MTIEGDRTEAMLISNGRHALGAGGREDETVFERHEANHLLTAFAPRHHQQAERTPRGRRPVSCASLSARPSHAA